MADCAVGNSVIQSRTHPDHHRCGGNDVLRPSVVRLKKNMSDDPNQIVSELIDRWCDRRELQALAKVLPAFTGNNGLTDGWNHLHDNLKHAYVMCRDIPSDERDQLKRAYVAIDVALKTR